MRGSDNPLEFPEGSQDRRDSGQQTVIFPDTMNLGLGKWQAGTKSRVQFSALQKKDMVVPACDFSSGKVEAEGQKLKISFGC